MAVTVAVQVPRSMSAISPNTPPASSCATVSFSPPGSSTVASAAALLQEVGAARGIAVAHQALALRMRDGPGDGEQQVARFAVEAIEEGLHAG